MGNYQNNDMEEGEESAIADSVMLRQETRAEQLSPAMELAMKQGFVSSPSMLDKISSMNPSPFIRVNNPIGILSRKERHNKSNPSSITVGLSWSF